MQEAGLHASTAAVWDEELELLKELPVSSEELFRLAMDFRKVEEAAPQEDVEATGLEPEPRAASEASELDAESEPAALL